MSPCQSVSNRKWWTASAQTHRCETRSTDTWYNARLMSFISRIKHKEKLYEQQQCESFTVSSRKRRENVEDFIFYLGKSHIESVAVSLHPSCSSPTHISYHNQNSRRRRVSNKKIRYLSAQWSTSSCLSLSVCYDNCLSICSTLSWCLFLSLPTLCLPK